MNAVPLLEELLCPDALSFVFQPIFFVDGAAPVAVALEALTRGPRGTPFERPDVLFDYVRLKRAECELDRACLQTILNEFRAMCVMQRLGINVHASTLGRDREFPYFLQCECERRQVSPSHVVVEIVEHSPVWNRGQFLHALAELRAAGVKIALDDVGLGNSNYRMILDSRPDYFKLDRDIVSGCSADAGRRAVLSSVVRLATDLGAQVIAEGVEREDDLTTVLDVGIRLIQGYIFSTPLTPGELLQSGILKSNHGRPASRAAHTNMPPVRLQ